MTLIGLNAIALLEGFKGLLALLIAVGVNSLAGANFHHTLETSMLQLNMVPTDEYPSLLLGIVEGITRENVIFVTLLASLYACVRFVVAYGLWHRLRWTEWFAFLSGSIYIPFELYAIYEEANVLTVGVLALNVIIVAYMYWVLKQNSKTTV
ncbi:DUF2127 domain-containing protein [Marinomonas transparens]|uniref:DUF2127 domain-containing protein n=1 Tax=Marinomonas transparens TaxID=2795388 RepID=A0A934JMU5_9GAMM|nr:DUF2127 domain-containing protein [Marinomonas transparens]MBJ7537328.1 DUF2127 domain-containing protein [Marinomonas transparens]